MADQSTALVEILPPDQPDDGPRHHGWKKGESGNPNGRPPGVAIGFTRTMRDALLESFQILGGTDYLVMLGYWKPEVYAQLIGRAMPLKVVGDDEGITVINRVERVVRPKPVA